MQQYFNIAFLMGKPQDLPGGRTQLQIGVAMALISYVLALAVPFGIERAFLQAVLDLSCTGLVIWLALAVVGHPGRFEQAFGGLCGASAFVNFAAIPLFAFRPAVREVSNTSISTMADFMLLVWSLSLLALVLRHTFEVKMLISILLSVTFFIFLSSVMAGIWPEDLESVEAARVSYEHYQSILANVSVVNSPLSANTVA